MSSTRANRDLLFGLLAWQMGCIGTEPLMAAVRAWLRDKSQTLEELLARESAMGDDDRRLLLAMVERYSAHHGGDLSRCVAALSSLGTIADELGALEDDEIDATLSIVHGERTTAPSGMKSDPGMSVPAPASGGSRFRILRPHAKGGLGEVSIAHDTELNREVALKEMQRAYAGDEPSRLRFLLEAEVTGRLEHPGIVPVYGLGCSADGRPFYAMRFIRGDSLQEAVDAFHNRSNDADGDPFVSVEFRKLLGRFVDVCNAIEYAHARGVLHRDLKPGNIMLGKYGETLVVDWGLAKVRDRDDVAGGERIEPRSLGSASGSVPTQFGAVVGTPAFMPPEQAAGQLDELGPASDVYSLGATLFYLLTRRPPVQGTHVAELLRKVESGEIAGPRAVNAAVPRPLDAICMHALARRRDERYPSPQALADDVERYLADEPVKAHTEPLVVRIRRRLRKHPRSVAAMTAAVLVGLAGSVFVSIAISEKNQELAKANRVLAVSIEAERRATATAVASREQERLARRDAQREREIAQAVQNFLEYDLLRQADVSRQADRLLLAGRSADEVRPNPTVRELLDLAAARMSEEQLALRFPDEPLVQASVLRTIGVTYDSVGAYEKAIEHLVRAERLFTAVQGTNGIEARAARNWLAIAYQSAGQFGRAVELFEQLLEQTEASLGPEHENTIKVMQNLAMSYEEAGMANLALPIMESVAERLRDDPAQQRLLITVLNNLALSRESAGAISDAIELLEEVVQLARTELGDEHPETLALINNLASFYTEDRRPLQAAQLHEENVVSLVARLGPEHPTTLAAIANQANAYKHAGRLDEALELNAKLLELRRSTLGPRHPDTLTSMHNLAGTYHSVERHEAARQLYQETLQLSRETLGPEHPSVLVTMMGLAEVHLAEESFEQAIVLLNDILKIRKRLQPDHRDTLNALNNLGFAHLSAGHADQAIPYLEEATRSLETVLGPAHPDTLNSLGNLAGTYLSSGARDKALPQFAVFFQRYADSDRAPDSAVASAAEQIASYLTRFNEPAEAEQYLRKSLAIREQSAPDDWSLFHCKCLLAASLVAQGRHAAAEPLLIEGYQGLRERESAIPPPQRAILTTVLRDLVGLYAALGNVDEAARWQAELEKRLAKEPPESRDKN